MPYAHVNGIRLHYERHGTGEPVVLVSGAGDSGQSWLLHLGPELAAHGYQVHVYDNRGIPPSDECPDGFTVDDLVADLAALIETFGLAPARVVGTSMGAYVVQELAVSRPELIRQAVLMASRARADAMRTKLALAEAELAGSGAQLPVAYRAVARAMQMLSPSSLDDESAILDWLALLELAPPDGPGYRAQLALQPMPDRRAAYAGITVPCHVISFEHDLVTPARYGAELAEYIPRATFDLVGDAAHFGYLEQPDRVTRIILKHFTGDAARAEQGALPTRRRA